MFKMHPGARAEPVLAAWGISTEGAPVFVALAASGSEATDAWGDFLDELSSRGLRPPLLVISDGAAGLINATESSLPRSLRQPCLIHRCHNYLAKLPAEAQTEMRDAYWAIFDIDELIAAGITPGHDLVAAVQRRIDAFADQHARTYPAAVKCLLTDRQQLTSYLRFPLERHRRIRHSNFIERTFGETLPQRGDPQPRQSHRPAARRDVLPQPRLGRARPRLPRLARHEHDHHRHPATRRPTPPTARPTNTDPTQDQHRRPRPTRACRSRRLTSPTRNPVRSIYTEHGTRPFTTSFTASSLYPGVNSRRCLPITDILAYKVSTVRGQGHYPTTGQQDPHSTWINQSGSGHRLSSGVSLRLRLRLIGEQFAQGNCAAPTPTARNLARNPWLTGLSELH